MMSDFDCEVKLITVSPAGDFVTASVCGNGSSDLSPFMLCIRVNDVKLPSMGI